MAKCLSVRLSIRLSVRLSVRLSHAHILCKRLNISPSGTPTILVFSHQTGWQYCDGTPNGGAECKGYEKITICDQYLTLSRN